MPTYVNQIDKLMEQFSGRESELVQTLEKMTERACRRNNTAAVHRSRKMQTTRLTQNWQTSEAVAHIAAACTIDEGVNINTDFWKEDTSVYSNDYLHNASKQELESLSNFDEEGSEDSSYYTEDECTNKQSESEESYYTHEESANYDENSYSYNMQDDT